MLGLWINKDNCIINVLFTLEWVYEAKTTSYYFLFVRLFSN